MKKIFFFLCVALVGFGCKKDIEGQLFFTKEDVQKGFRFPYFLFIPDEVPQESELFLIVEPNNSGFVSDDPDKHIEKAERTATKDFYIGNYVSRSLKYPLLVPVFPRPESDWKIYTHALDRDVMLQKGNDLERIDLQLLAMVEDAKSKLAEMGYTTNDPIIMTGFSASGTFVNRFTLIHPNHVLAAAAGGVNGLLILPFHEMQGKALEYPLGSNDFRELFNVPFDSAAFRRTPQFLFMGELDDNDAVPYDDGYDENERTIIYELLGKEMQPGRWNKCQEIYQREQINAQIKTYKGIGHEHPQNVKEDILKFLEACIK